MTALTFVAHVHPEDLHERSPDHRFAVVASVLREGRLVGHRPLLSIWRRHARNPDALWRAVKEAFADRIEEEFVPRKRPKRP